LARLPCIGKLVVAGVIVDATPTELFEVVSAKTSFAAPSSRPALNGRQHNPTSTPMIAINHQQLDQR